MILRSDSALLVPVYRCRRGRQVANSSHASTNETVSRLHLLHLQSDAQPPPPPSGSGKGAVGRGLRLTSLVHPKHVSLKPISTTATKFLQAANEGVERCFPIEHEAIQQIKTSCFCQIVPNPLKKVLCTSIFQIRHKKWCTLHTKMVLVPSLIYWNSASTLLSTLTYATYSRTASPKPSSRKVLALIVLQ